MNIIKLRLGKCEKCGQVVVVKEAVLKDLSSILRHQFVKAG